MDKKRIFINSSKASEAQRASCFEQEEVAPLPQSEQVPRNKNPYKRPILLSNHLFDQPALPSPQTSDAKEPANAMIKHARSQGDQCQQPRKVRADPPTDHDQRQAGEGDPIKNIFNDIMDHEKNIQQLHVISSIKKDIQNSTKDRKRKLNIEKIKSLRSTALGLSTNGQLSQEEQLSSKLLVRDLNFLSQQLGAPPQTEAAAAAQDDRGGEHEDAYSVEQSELTEDRPLLPKSRSLSKVSKYLGTYGSPKPQPQKARRKPIEEYTDRDLLPGSLGLALLPKNANQGNDLRLRSPIQQQISIQKA